jgi:hypothetical protein
VTPAFEPSASVVSAITAVSTSSASAVLPPSATISPDGSMYSALVEESEEEKSKLARSYEESVRKRHEASNKVAHLI